MRHLANIGMQNMVTDPDKAINILYPDVDSAISQMPLDQT
jgi:hypothetical protein